MNQTPVRFGVIGCGTIAYWSHLRELRTMKNARVAAVADPVAGARERAVQLTGAAAYENPDELLRREDVDAVVISAPTHLHAALAISAARAGKHIYLEKPVAIARDEAHELREVVGQAGVRVAVGFNWRCHPLYAQAHALIRGGTIGPLRAVLSTFSEPAATGVLPEWKRRRATGGGALLDLGSHHIDLLRWFTGGEIEEVEGRLWSRGSEEDEAWLRLRLRDGIESRSFFSLRAARADFIEFIGESGTLRVDRHLPWLSVRVSRKLGYGVRSAFPFPPPNVLRWWVARLRRPSYQPSYRMALGAFIESIQGKAVEQATLDDGIASLEVVLAAEESARS